MVTRTTRCGSIIFEAMVSLMAFFITLNSDEGRKWARKMQLKSSLALTPLRCARKVICFRNWNQGRAGSGEHRNQCHLFFQYFLLHCPGQYDITASNKPKNMGNIISLTPKKSTGKNRVVIKCGLKFDLNSI